jgi:uncharacterized integral membrane protein
MQKKLIVFLIFAVLVAIFALQNSAEADIKLWFWSVKTSLALVLILSVAFGALAGILFSLPGLSKKKEKETPEHKEHVEPDETAHKNRKGKDPEFEEFRT